MGDEAGRAVAAALPLLTALGTLALMGNGFSGEVDEQLRAAAGHVQNKRI
jgi:hypothetical protein